MYKKRGILLVGIIIFFGLMLVLAATFLDVSQSDFNNGTYANTTYNGSAVVLVGNNLSGTFTSRVFDATGASRWDNFSFNINLPTKEYIYVVDAQSDVWNSSDQATTWFLVKDDYNSGDGNGVTASFFNKSGSFFVIFNQDVWRSDNLGVNWTKLTDNYNGAEGQNAFVAAVDKNNLMYIIEGDQDVWKSNNSGVNWTKATTDFNGGNGNFFGFVVNSSNTLIAVDSAADVWKSDNQGVNWSLLKDDYNGAEGNNADGMAVDVNNTLYVFDLQDVWESNDSGITWTKINDDINGAGDTNNGKAITTDSNGYVYVIDGSEDVFKSTNGGTTFTKVATNFNGANGAASTMATILMTTNLTFQVKTCSNSNCSDGNFIGPDGTSNTYFTNLTNAMNLTGRYFQYKAYLTSQDSSVIPQLYNVSIGYTILDNIPPNLSIISPINKSYNNASILVNISAVDNTAVDKIWFYNGSTNITYTTPVSYTFKQESNTLIAYANDTFGNLNFSSITFVVDSINPGVSIIYPTNITYSATTIAFNYTVSDVNLQACKYSLNNGLTNTTITCGNNVSSISINEGSNTIKLYVNDSLGNTNSSSVSFVRDTIPPLVNLVSPQNISYTSNNILINITNSSDTRIVWFYNGSTNITYAGIISQVFSEGSNRVIAYANDSVNNLNSSSITFVVDSEAPIINLVHPTNSFIFGRNNSLPLNFSVSDAVSGVGTCRYNVDNGINKTLTNCQNTTFNVSGDGSHSLILFANDSLGNVNNVSVSFSVVTNAPALNLVSPDNNSYLNYTNNIYFNYSIVSGIGVSSCQFWGDFNGTWALNQTNSSISLENNFFLNSLNSGNYLWGIICNDTLNRKSNVNNTLHIDTTAPVITLTQPSGSKTSRVGIPLNFLINDTSPVSCIYNVFFSGASEHISNKSVGCSLGSSSFNVSSDGDFILNFYVNDSAGNKNSQSLSFSVDTSTPISPPSGGSSGGGSSGGGSSFSLVTGKIDIGTLADIISLPGDSKKLSLKVKNTGLSFLNNCKLKGSGEYSSWISASGNNKIGGGESLDFSFNLNVPKDIAPGSYVISLIYQCDETSKETSFSVNVLEKQIGFNLIDSKLETNTLKVRYSLEELSGIDKNVDLQFLLYDPSNTKVAEFNDKKELSAGSNKEFEADIPLGNVQGGNYNLLVNINSQTYSSFIQESIVLGSRASGLSIFGTNINVNIIGSTMIVLFVIFALFMIARIMKLRKGIKRTKDYSYPR